MFYEKNCKPADGCVFSVASVEYLCRWLSCRCLSLGLVDRCSRELLDAMLSLKNVFLAVNPSFNREKCTLRPWLQETELLFLMFYLRTENNCFLVQSQKIFNLLEIASLVNIGGRSCSADRLSVALRISITKFCDWNSAGTSSPVLVAMWSVKNF